MPTPAPNTYPFDSTGTLIDNAIEDEIHTLSPINFADYYCVIPDFAPFYAASLSILYRSDPSGPWLTMNENQDYFCAYQFVGATRQTALPVYGSIVFNNIALTGEVKLSYQTVGGEWTLEQDKLTEMLVNLIYNPRTTTWEQVSGAPSHFPPSEHAWQLDDLVGMQEVVDSLNDIHDAILNRDSTGDLSAHITDFNNPHKTTKSHVGLSRVMNYPPATIAETIDGQNPELYVTPTGLHAYIDSLGLNDALNFVSLEEVINKVSVNKILTFDLFLLFMKIYYGLDTDPVDNNTLIPNIVIPGEGGDYTPTQMFTCNTFVADAPGTIARTVSLSGVGSYTIPQGTTSVRITGRGAIGGSVVPAYTTITTAVSELGQGTIVIPAGGSIMSIRGRGGAGTQSNSAGIYKPNGLGNFTNVPTPNPGPGEPSWSYSVVTSFATNYQINGQLDNVTTQLVVRKNFSNGTSFTAAPITVTLGKTGSNFSGSVLSYAGSFTVTFGDATSLTAVYEAEFARLPGTDVNVGATATVTINGATRSYVGSTTQSPPDTQSQDIAIVPTETTTINYNSPAGTFLEIIYQDYTLNGTWAIKRYYSSKITNPSTGTSALLEDIDGSIVTLTPGTTGQSLSSLNSISTVPSATITGTYNLVVVPGSSNANFRLFEINYNVGGVPVTIRVVAEFTANVGQSSAGASASATILGNTLTYPGSANNLITPELRTETITLSSSFSTNITYDAPAGSSIAIAYSEVSNSTALTHSDTIWEISTDEFFGVNDIVDSTEEGKGSGFTLTQWRPTLINSFVNNTNYFVRCRWVRSDDSLSDWSEVRQFRFIAAVSYPPRDTEQGRFCKNFDLYGTYSDGQGGTYDRVIYVNSPTCGYVAPVGDRYITATGGVTYDVGCWRVHEFREPGVQALVAQDIGTFGGVVEYLVVGNGGPGGNQPGNNPDGTGAGAGGGGGGGDVIAGSRVIALGSNPINISANISSPGNGGDNSFMDVIAVGGGRGGAYNGSYVNAVPGGNGGGAGQPGTGQTKLGAVSSSGRGFKGGDVVLPSGQATGGGAGGGGAGGVGQDAQSRGAASPIHGGAGGPGVVSSITGTAKYYGAGGGGAGCNASSANGVPTGAGDAGAGGSGVGGNGATFRRAYATAGAINSGSGGGGGNGRQRPGANGAIGTVIVRYRACSEEVPDPTCITATGGVETEITVAGQAYKVHTFLSSGTFTINKSCGRDSLEYLVVGGGGGGSNDTGGGGGAGGFLVGQSITGPGTYAVTVGGGGGISANGGNSQIASISQVALGGGAGGILKSNGGSGGSGGGAGGIYPKPTSNVPANFGGSGSGGNRGGNRGASSTGRTGSAGGGGAGTSGGDVNGDSREGGAGGSGLISSISGTDKFYAGGGGGAGAAGGGGGAGGLGGGGAGGSESQIPGTAGQPNTGGGGGASGGGASAGTGGSGIVIIRYKIYKNTNATSTRIAATGGVESEITVSGQKYKVHVFNNTAVLNVTRSGAADQTMEYLLIGGGGGGGGRGGGGGAGGFNGGFFKPIIGSYDMVVGAGGLGTVQNSRDSTNGGATSAFTITVAGGGGGGNYRSGAGKAGASGGGAGGSDKDKDTVGALGGTGIVGNGNAGGRNVDGAYTGGGGGGAGSAGGNASRNSSNGIAGAGGSGFSSSITGTAKMYCAGGGGSGVAGSTPGLGGSGIGGNGSNFAGGTGAANTGSGGGSGGSSGGVWSAGGDGAAGVIVVRYKID